VFVIIYIKREKARREKRAGMNIGKERITGIRRINREYGRLPPLPTAKVG